MLSCLRRYKGVIAVLLLALFAFMWSSSHFFPHKHIIGSQIITHSHPYSHGRTHDHSSNEINLLSHIAQLAFVIGAILSFGLLFGQHYVVLNHRTVDFIVTFSGNRRLHRGPPVELI